MNKNIFTNIELINKLINSNAGDEILKVKLKHCKTND